MPESEDAVVEALEQIFGQRASVYSDIEKQTTRASIFVPKVNRTQRLQLRKALKAIRQAGLEIGSGPISVRRIPRENWAESWKRHFKPLEVSSKLLVIPSWSERKPRPGQAVVILDPGLSFGTGHHPTTGFCLEQIAALYKPHQIQSFLDVGCGSGILSIAAKKLGYSPVVAFDFDGDAVRVARENATVNSVRFSISQKDLARLPLRSTRLFSVVAANLIYDLLIQERSRIMNRVAPDGVLVLAGILRTQFATVRRAFEGAGMVLAAQRAAGEWRSGTFRFRSRRTKTVQPVQSETCE